MILAAADEIITKRPLHRDTVTTDVDTLVLRHRREPQVDEMIAKLGATLAINVDV